MVTGPFPIAQIEKNIAVGRLRATDLVSNDGDHWNAVADNPDLVDFVQESRRRDGSAQFDERQCERRRSGAAGVSADGLESRVETDRRRGEPSEIVTRRERSRRVWRSMRADKLGTRGPITAVAVGLGVIVVLGLALRTPHPDVSPDCTSEPQPAVNWDFCQKSNIDLKQLDLHGISARNSRLAGSNLAGANLANANLAYADLENTDMELADLSGARLIGANLRATNLSYANLRAADLQFVDLTNADLQGADLRDTRLGNAIWSDGRQCAPHAIGACVSGSSTKD